jgi:hypothetical protein
MKRIQVRDFETNNKDSKDFFKLINFAGLSGLLGGILIGCLLLSTLILFSYSFLVETGHAFIIVAYAINKYFCSSKSAGIGIFLNHKYVFTFLYI